MCIIAAKPAGVDMPDYVSIHNMFENNDDGAGFMYAANGKVYIEKGFMTEFAFAQRINEIGEVYDLKSLPMVMHFRITTHGGTKPENCHPFPITDSMGMLKKRKCRTDIGVAHNGIIDITPKDKNISDTMAYIATQLAPLKRAVPLFYKNKDLLEMIYNAIDSKMVIMNGKGEMVFIGSFIDEGGVKYSNTSYAYNKKYYRDFPYSYCSGGLDTDCPFEAQDYKVMELMLIDESKGEYVTDRNGQMYTGEDFAIDALGHVYTFDPCAGLFFRDGAVYAYNAEGMPLKFKADSLMTFKEYVCEGFYYE